MLIDLYFVRTIDVYDAIYRYAEMVIHLELPGTIVCAEILVKISAPCYTHAGNILRSFSNRLGHWYCHDFECNRVLIFGPHQSYISMFFVSIAIVLLAVYLFPLFYPFYFSLTIDLN